MRMLLILYDFFFIPISLIFVFFFSLFNRKIRRGLAGRLGNFSRLRQKLSQCPAEQKTILFHVSSFGEFLQAKPVMEKLKQKKPELCIVVSVFSPSGFDNIEEQFPVDALCYLPIDGYTVMKKFVETVAPQAAVIVRHDVWPNFVWRLRRNKIPAVLIDATLPEKSVRYLPVIKNLFRALFNQLSAILAVSQKEKNHFRRLLGNDEKVHVFGDTKYDQVFDRSSFGEKFLQFSNHQIFQNKQIFVAGSTWHDDEEVLIPSFQDLAGEIENAFLIIAPHEPREERIEEIRHACREMDIGCALLSELQSGENIEGARCLIVDMIGVLANIYSLGKVAFVGGSFYAKIHNVLEPAVYGIPVLMGPKMRNSAEAIDLVESGSAQIVRDGAEMSRALVRMFQDDSFTRQNGERAKMQVMKNVGSSEKIADFLLTLID
ncbi:MAG: hypothetical protein GXO74_03025 [Calditrichaeota bacterium]|nr:hypothetical protein [Calditrichota bacterium]